MGTDIFSSDLGMPPPTRPLMVPRLLAAQLRQSRNVRSKADLKRLVDDIDGIPVRSTFASPFNSPRFVDFGSQCGTLQRTSAYRPS